MGNFMGKDGFVWFVGVVEDRLDPTFTGRVRVRCLGYHTENLIKLPTEDLPWSHVMNPVTSATVSGVGQTPLGLVEGSWVMGFFRDGAEAQQPVIMGALPGLPAQLPQSQTEVDEMKEDVVAGKSMGTYSKTGKKILVDNFLGGFQDPFMNYPRYAGEPDVNRLAVNATEEGMVKGAVGQILNTTTELNPHPSLLMRRADQDAGVATASIESSSALGNVQDEQIGLYGDTILQDYGTPWDELNIPGDPFTAVYPYNHVYESESGHIKEYDDTPGASRIHERHASGSGYEIANDGTKVTKVQGDNYSITKGTDYVHIMGDRNETVDGGVRVVVNKESGAKNNYNVHCMEGATVTVQVDKGDINLVALGDGKNEGNINLFAQRNINFEADGNISMITRGDFEADVQGHWDELVAGYNHKTGTFNQWYGTSLRLTHSSTHNFESGGITNIIGSIINLN